MRLRLLSAVCAAVLTVIHCISLPLFTLAEEEVTFYGGLQCIFNAAPDLRDSESYRFVFGSRAYETYTAYRVTFVSGSRSYVATRTTDSDWSYYGSNSNAGAFYAAYWGYYVAGVGIFYYDSSADLPEAKYAYHMQYYGTNSETTYEKFVSYGPEIEGVYVTNYVTAGDYFDSLAPQDPTEPSGSGDGFRLPEDWISGGNTLDSAEPVTFGTADLDDAIGELESMDYTTPPDILGAVGAFWFIFDGFVESSELFWLVIVSLIIVLVAWFLGRRV